MTDATSALAALASASPVAPLPSIAERIRLRTAFGVTQQALADALNVSRKTVNGWETGKGVPTGINRTKYAALLAAWQETENNNS